MFFRAALGDYFQTWFGWLLPTFSLVFFQTLAARRYFVKKVFLKHSQNSQENTCAKVSFLIKLKASCLHLYLKKTLAQACHVSCGFCEILNNTFFMEYLWWLLLFSVSSGKLVELKWKKTWRSKLLRAKIILGSQSETFKLIFSLASSKVY